MISIKCALCDEFANMYNERYFIVSSREFFVPNCYVLCDEHKDIQMVFEDFYNENGTRKKIEKERIINERT
jgi:hypothetical protein